jgi:LPS-assembly protein
VAVVGARYVLGAGYVDGRLVFGVNYVTSSTYSAGTTPPVLSHGFMFNLGLRTFGSTAASASGGTVQ